MLVQVVNSMHCIRSPCYLGLVLLPPLVSLSLLGPPPHVRGPWHFLYPWHPQDPRGSLGKKELCAVGSLRGLLCSRGKKRFPPLSTKLKHSKEEMPKTQILVLSII